jgi:sulfite reductase (NADPH) hemoprotein beta-component
MAELALVGKAPGKYQLYLGGNESSTRLGRLYKESVKNEDLATELRPLFERFARERLSAERFGDFCHRVLLPAAVAPVLAPEPATVPT